MQINFKTERLSKDYLIFNIYDVILVLHVFMVHNKLCD